MADRYTCYAVVAPGLEPLAARELTALGLPPDGTEPGGVAFAADAAALATANLRLRTVSRVLVRAATFEARTFFELERHAGRVPWDRFVPAGGAVHFRVTSHKSKLYHQDAVAERLERAVLAGVPAVTAVRGAQAADDLEADLTAPPPVQRFVVRLLHDRCTVSADSSGALLHQRGYRQATAKAPLRETLAAALLVATEWDGRVPLLDPLCGSGTIPIEAALLARGIAPGLGRAFAFERWPSWDGAVGRQAREAAQALVLPRAPAPILGSDRDAGAIAAATANAARAGVAADINFRRSALSAVEPPDQPGLLLTNPPYGVRIGDRTRLRDLYAAIGRLAGGRFAAWQVALLSADPGLERATGLPLVTLLETTNGGIRVRLRRRA